MTVNRPSLVPAVLDRNIKLLQLVLRYEVRLHGISQLTPSDYVAIVYEQRGPEAEIQLILQIIAEFEWSIEYEKLGFLLIKH